MRASVTVLVALLAFGAATLAQAEKTKRGNVIVTFDGGIDPHTLPRDTTSPVSVWVNSTIDTADGAKLPPQLETIAIAINREGKIFDRGLPTCQVRRIQPSTMAAARRICGGAIVGNGEVQLQVALEKDSPFTFNAPLLAFNARGTNGNRRILVQAYGGDPPSAFVLPFAIRERAGTFGTVISTTLPESAQGWAYVTRFDLRLQRRYIYQGQEHSYVSAACPAPEGFPGAVYPFAKASYGFEGGASVSTTLTRDCAVSSGA